MQDVAQTKKEDRQSQEKMNAQEAREMRIRKWQEGADERKSARDHTNRLDLTDYEHTLTEEAKDADRSFEGGQSELDRQNRIAVAEINNRGRAGSQQEWEKQRLKAGTISVADGMGGETETATMVDQFTGVTYALVDGIWQAPPRMEGFGKNADRVTSIKVQPKNTPGRAIDALKENRSEAMIEQFFDKYGWLPVWSFHGKASTRAPAR